MKYWLISDTHFNHSKLEDWGGRTGDWQEKIWKGIHDIPKYNGDDVLIHLGDLCIGDDKEVMKRWDESTAGITTILIRGNHDKKSATWYTMEGFNFVCDQIGLVFQGVDILLSHRPMPPDTWRYRYNIHGHTHGNMHRAEEYSAWYDPKNFHIDISPEIVGYQPILLETLMKKHKL